MNYTYEHYKKSADYILSRTSIRPEIGIILGTGLGPFAQQIENPVEIPYSEIPNFLTSSAPGHAGKFILGTIEGRSVACMSGRFHFYEGYDMEQLSIPVRVLKLLGISRLVLTNAAGAVNTVYRPGDVMIISDHIKLYGGSPMRGPNVEQFGKRFFDVSDMYTAALRDIARKCAESSPIRFHEGIYMFFPGPQFETPAEIRAARVLGADAIGMSTVTEALTAAHCGLSVLAFALITNMAAGVKKGPVGGGEVEETASKVASAFSSYMKSVISRI